MITKPLCLYCPCSVRDLHGDVGVASSDSSSSESEDEEGVWSPQTETDFLRTLSLLKKKDPQIYDKDVSFYFAGEHQKVSLGHNQTKAVYLKDYDRERLLDRGRYVWANHLVTGGGGGGGGRSCSING